MYKLTLYFHDWEGFDVNMSLKKMLEKMEVVDYDLDELTPDERECFD